MRANQHILLIQCWFSSMLSHLYKSHLVDLNSCSLILIKVFHYSDLRQLQPQWEMHTGSLTCLYILPSHLCSIPQLPKSNQRGPRLYTVSTHSIFFSCTVLLINPVKSLKNGFFFSLVRSCRLFSFLSISQPFKPSTSNECTKSASSGSLKRSVHYNLSSGLDFPPAKSTS